MLCSFHQDQGRNDLFRLSSYLGLSELEIPVIVNTENYSRNWSHLSNEGGLNKTLKRCLQSGTKSMLNIRKKKLFALKRKNEALSLALSSEIFLKYISNYIQIHTIHFLEIACWEVSLKKELITKKFKSLLFLNCVWVGYFIRCFTVEKNLLWWGYGFLSFLSCNFNYLLMSFFIILHWTPFTARVYGQ